MFWPAFYYHGNEPFRFSFVGIKRWNIAVRICSLANEDLRFVFIISGLSSFLILAAMFPPPPRFLEMVVFFCGEKRIAVEDSHYANEDFRFIFFASFLTSLMKIFRLAAKCCALQL